MSRQPNPRNSNRRGLGQQPQLPRPGDGLGAVGHLQLAEQVAEVALDGVQGDHQLLGDGPVGRTGGQQPEHFQFAGAQRLDQPRHHHTAAADRVADRQAGLLEGVH
jgi:hypothetical protein